MRALRLITLTLPLFLVAGFFLSSCASSTSSSTDLPSSDGLFEDSDTKRLKIQEDMTRMTRELTIF